MTQEGIRKEPMLPVWPEVTSLGGGVEGGSTLRLGASEKGY